MVNHMMLKYTKFKNLDCKIHKMIKVEWVKLKKK